MLDNNNKKQKQKQRQEKNCNPRPGYYYYYYYEILTNIITSTINIHSVALIFVIIHKKSITKKQKQNKQTNKQENVNTFSLKYFVRT